MNLSGPGYRYLRNERYSVISLLNELNDAQWSEIEKIGTDLIAELTDLTKPTFLVDLTDLDRMGSSMVALIVRLWKSVKDRDGQMVVVSNSPIVGEVLELSGLSNLWTITETIEDGLDALGVTPEARAIRRENKLVTWLAPIALVVTVAGVTVIFLRTVLPDLQRIGLILTVGGAVLGLIAGIVTCVRESGGRRGLAIGLVVVCAALAAAGLWKYVDAQQAGGDDQTRLRNHVPELGPWHQRPDHWQAIEELES